MKIPLICPSCHGSKGTWGSDGWGWLKLNDHKRNCKRCNNGYILIDSDTGKEVNPI